VITKAGFDRTTLAEVAKAAKAAKISTGTSRHYYSNRAGPLLDALLTAREWFQCRMRSQLYGLDPD
jgi:AcrR family transcriptional regulator